MKNFCQSQFHFDSGVLPSDITQFISSHKGDNDRCDNAEILKFIHIQSSPLHLIKTYALFSEQKLVKPLPPHKTQVLASSLSCQLQNIYNQLYPTRLTAHMSHFYRKYGRVSLSGDVIGCSMPGTNSHSSSVIAACILARNRSIT